MIHANRIVTVGEQESIIDRPIVLYRGDREVEIEFTLVGNEFTFSEEGNVIKSVNASHGQLVLNTPSGEHMFSELAECHEGKVVFVVTKEMIDEFIEMGFYSFQIRLYDSAEMKSRVTIPPVMNGFDIRNPIAAEDETNVVDQGIVDYARIFKDQSNEELPTFDWTGAYNKTEWAHHDVITENKMNKIEDALYFINANVRESDVVMLNTLDQVKKDADAYVKEHMAEVEADVEEFERNLNTGVETFKIDTNAAMTTHKNEVSEVVDGFSGEIESINSQLAHVENKQLLCPDDFDGNDVEKISLFMNYLIENNINYGFLNREYDITGYTVYLDFSDINRYIHIEGGGIIKNDDGYVFSSNLNDLNRNAFTFTNTRFISNGSATLWDGNNYIRQKVENCYFNGMAFVHSDTYIQSVYVANCEISNLHSNFIDSINCYDLNFSMNRCEASANTLIKIVNTNTDGISFFKCRIDSNLIEGYTTSSPIILSGGYGLSITNNYFEANNYDIKLDPVGSTKYTCEISNNTFGNNRDADFNIYTTNASINAYGLDIHHNLTTLNDANKAFTNVNIIRDNLGNNSTTGSVGNVVPKSSAYKVRNNGITPTITGDNGVTFEFKIKLSNLLWQKKNKSYLIHLNSTIAGSVLYSGFMNGIVSIHTFNTGSNGIKSYLTFKLLDGYKNNLNEISDSDFSYYFKETGEKYIDYAVNEFTIIVNIPGWLYNASYTNGNLIDLSSVNQSYYITKE